MGISEINTVYSITLRPSQTYLFSYVWLALELFFMHLIIYHYFPEHFEYLATAFFVAFARFYYWLDFSPETGFQSIYILGMIPLHWFINSVGGTEYHKLIVIFYLFSFIALGSIRIALTKYRITHSNIIVQLIGSKIFVTDQSRQPELAQHGRGKILNFGCILMPVAEVKNKADTIFLALLFRKRYDAKYSGYLRIDGIRNPKEVTKQLKHLIQLENN